MIDNALKSPDKTKTTKTSTQNTNYIQVLYKDLYLVCTDLYVIFN